MRRPLDLTVWKVAVLQNRDSGQRRRAFAAITSSCDCICLWQILDCSVKRRRLCQRGGPLRRKPHPSLFPPPGGPPAGGCCRPQDPPHAHAQPRIAMVLAHHGSPLRCGPMCRTSCPLAVGGSVWTMRDDRITRKGWVLCFKRKEVPCLPASPFPTIPTT